MKEYEICEFCPTHNSDFQHSKLYPFQPASGLFLQLIFLKFRDFRFLSNTFLWKKGVMKENDNKLYKIT